jgi:hypothetical protein
VVSRTVAIVDFAHSGTTMLAGVLEILGIPMVGPRYRPLKWEDLDVIESLRDEQRFALLVAQRHKEHAIWGFKYPGAWKFAPLLERYLDDPVYLAIFKEPVSVTGRRFNAVTLNKLGNTLEQMRLAAEGMRATGWPIHLLSYHRATVAPLAFVTELMQVTGIRTTPGRVDAAVRFIQPNPEGGRRPYPAVEGWR